MSIDRVPPVGGNPLAPFRTLAPATKSVTDRANIAKADQEILGKIPEKPCRERTDEELTATIRQAIRELRAKPGQASQEFVRHIRLKTSFQGYLSIFIMQPSTLSYGRQLERTGDKGVFTQDGSLVTVTFKGNKGNLIHA